MAKLFPPQGVLFHEAEENLIVTSQEENLSQDEYIYQHLCGGSSDTAGIDNNILQAVLKLQALKKGKLETDGTAVIFSKNGMCLTANHCIEAAKLRGKDKHLQVGCHEVEILARDRELDIACLWIAYGDDTDFNFVSLEYTSASVPNMKIHLISYPFMLEDDFKTTGPTVTHGQLASALNHYQCSGDYARFPNSSGGAIISNNKLIGIHTEETYHEEKRRTRSMSNAQKLGFSETPCTQMLSWSFCDCLFNWCFSCEAQTYPKL